MMEIRTRGKTKLQKKAALILMKEPGHHSEVLKIILWNEFHIVPWRGKTITVSFPSNKAEGA